jgi:hypothetical protein
MIRPIDQESVQSNEAARKGKQLSGTPLTAALSAARALRPAWSVGCVALQDSGALGQLFCSVLKFRPVQTSPMHALFCYKGRAPVRDQLRRRRTVALSVRTKQACKGIPARLFSAHRSPALRSRCEKKPAHYAAFFSFSSS